MVDKAACSSLEHLDRVGFGVTRISRIKRAGSGPLGDSAIQLKKFSSNI